MEKSTTNLHRGYAMARTYPVPPSRLVSHILRWTRACKANHDVSIERKSGSMYYLLAGVKSNVLQEHDVAASHRSDALLHLGPDAVIHLNHLQNG